MGGAASTASAASDESSPAEFALINDHLSPDSRAAAASPRGHAPATTPSPAKSPSPASARPAARASVLVAETQAKKNLLCLLKMRLVMTGGGNATLTTLNHSLVPEGGGSGVDVSASLDWNFECTTTRDSLLDGANELTLGAVSSPKLASKTARAGSGGMLSVAEEAGPGSLDLDSRQQHDGALFVFARLDSVASDEDDCGGDSAREAPPATPPRPLTLQTGRSTVATTFVRGRGKPPPAGLQVHLPVSLYMMPRDEGGGDCDFSVDDSFLRSPTVTLGCTPVGSSSFEVASSFSGDAVDPRVPHWPLASAQPPADVRTSSTPRASSPPLLSGAKERRRPSAEHNEARRRFRALEQSVTAEAAAGGISNGWASLSTARTDEAAACVSLWRVAAEAGDSEAQFSLGVVHGSGRGVAAVDKAEAMRWYQLAADQGHAMAQFNLGLAHATGAAPWFKRDPSAAERLYRLAAQQGHAFAQYNLGIMLENGDGPVPPDQHGAGAWFLLAARQGHAKSQFILGVKHERGLGMPKDLVAAVGWYQLAADQGKAEALLNLGIMYAGGSGVQQDFVKAVHMYREASRLGLAAAMFNMGVMFHNGQGVPQDYAMAVRWMYRAAAGGHPRAQEAVKHFQQAGFSASDAAAAAKIAGLRLKPVSINSVIPVAKEGGHYGNGALGLQPPQESQEAANQRVLVADDSATVRKFMKRSLEKGGYEVDIAEDGSVAFDKMKERPYAMVFLDLDMPVVNGFSCTDAFRAWERDSGMRDDCLPQLICVVSSYSTEWELARCAEVGVDFFETKPAKIADLLRIANLRATELGGKLPGSSSGLGSTRVVTARHRPSLLKFFS